MCGLSLAKSRAGHKCTGETCTFFIGEEKLGKIINAKEEKSRMRHSSPAEEEMQSQEEINNLKL